MPRIRTATKVRRDSEPPLEVIARLLCKVPRVPSAYGSETRVTIDGVDAAAFIMAMTELRLERADKDKMAEATRLQLVADETRRRLQELADELPAELVWR